MEDIAILKNCLSEIQIWLDILYFYLLIGNASIQQEFQISTTFNLGCRCNALKKWQDFHLFNFHQFPLFMDKIHLPPTVAKMHFLLDLPGNILNLARFYGKVSLTLSLFFLRHFIQRKGFIRGHIYQFWVLTTGFSSSHSFISVSLRGVLIGLCH